MPIATMMRVNVPDRLVLAIATPHVMRVDLLKPLDADPDSIMFSRDNIGLLQSDWQPRLPSPRRLSEKS